MTNGKMIPGLESGTGKSFTFDTDAKPADMYKPVRTERRTTKTIKGITFNYAEMIETLVQSKTSGAMGNYIDLAHVHPGMCRIEITDDEGKCDMAVIVWRDSARLANRWVVSFCGLEHCDAELYLAAKSAVDDAARHPGPRITKNVQVFPERYA